MLVETKIRGAIKPAEFLFGRGFRRSVGGYGIGQAVVLDALAYDATTTYWRGPHAH